MWVEKGHCPVHLSNASARILEPDLAAGKIHTLVWCATGWGWEQAVEPPTLQLHALQTELTKLQALEGARIQVLRDAVRLSWRGLSREVEESGRKPRLLTKCEVQHAEGRRAKVAE